ncbi:MAG: hypothetical protein LBB16_01940 [Puniceicoccales bacterium]|jgi:hypothetical protein|nr:hypothetical protein [Puniceicoccales bacterium]
MSIVRTFVLSIYLLLIATNTHCATATKCTKERNMMIKYVSIRQFDDGAFKTIGEYFGRKREHQYFRCIGRDDENARTGTYFIVGLNKSIAKCPKEIFAKIYVITSLREEVHLFKCRVPDDRSVFVSEIYCGITSTPLDIRNIKAWKVEFADKNNKVLCAKQSYMWQ